MISLSISVLTISLTVLLGHQANLQIQCLNCLQRDPFLVKLRNRPNQRKEPVGKGALGVYQQSRRRFLGNHWTSSSSRGRPATTLALQTQMSKFQLNQLTSLFVFLLLETVVLRIYLLLHFMLVPYLWGVRQLHFCSRLLNSYMRRSLHSKSLMAKMAKTCKISKILEFVFKYNLYYFMNFFYGELRNFLILHFLPFFWCSYSTVT